MLIGEHYHIKRLWRGNQPSCQVVDKKFLVTQTRIGAHRFLYDRAQAPIGARQYRVLSSQSHATGIAGSLSDHCQLTRGNRQAIHLLISTDTQGIGSPFSSGMGLPP